MKRKLLPCCMRRTVFSLPLLLASVHAAAGQTSTTGAIRGTVTDPQGAVLATATVTVTSQGTAAVRKSATDKDGQYTVGLLPPGLYNVTIAAPGFKTENPGAITVVVTETSRVDASLVLGSQSETVDVTSQGPALQVENAAVGTVVDGSVIQELPLANRNYTEVLTMTAGITGDLNNAATLGKGTPDVYVNGASSISNNFHMDGADINNFASGRAGDFVQQAGIPIPDPDALQEYKIQTTQYDAGFGRDAGANVDVITRSGTNTIHGSLWEFFRNDVLNANDTFLKLGGQPRPEMKQNMFGGTIGGKIIKDKFFYFGSYQGTRQINGLSSSSIYSSALFPLTNDRSAAGIGAVACPSSAGTAAPASATQPPSYYWHPYDGGAYSGTTAAPIKQAEVACNGSNVNPVAMYLLNYKIPNGTYLIPTPQRYTLDSHGNPIGQSTWSIPSTYYENQFMANTDYLLSPRHTLAERFFWSHYPEYEPFSASDPPGNGVSTIFSSQMSLIKLTSALTPHFLNEGLVGYIRSAGHLQTSATLLATQIGMTAPSAPQYPLDPTMSVTGYFSLGGGGNDESSSVVNTFEISDQISWTHNKQSIRAGFSGEKNQFDFNDPQQERGSLGFSTMQDFLLGMSAAQNGSPYSNLNSVGSQQGSYYKGYRGTEMAMFVQDDYKLRPNLTVNLGLRWELMSGVSFGHGEESSFWPSLVTQFQPIPAGGSYTGYVVPNNYTGAMPAGLTRLGSRSLQANDIPLHNFGPRIGFAWQPFGASATTVVRGGVGIFYTLPNANSVLQTLGGQPFVSSASLSNANDQTSTFQTPFTAVLTPGTWQPLLPGTATKTVTAVAENSDAPQVEQMNLEVQQELPKKLVLEVGYVGTRGTRLAEGRDINRAFLASPSNPINGVTSNTTAAANIDARVPYQGLSAGGLTEIETYGFSWYNSLQTTVRRQLSRGFYVSTAYTWSKAMTSVYGGDGTNGVFEGGSGNFNDPDNRHARYGLAGYDRTNRLVSTYTYAFPSWKNGNAFERGATGGWKLSGATTFQTGKPLTFTDSRNGTAYGTTSASEFLPGVSNGSILNKTGGTMLNRVRNNSYLNPTASLFGYAPQVPYSALNGNVYAYDYGNVRIGAVRGPGNDNWDMALTKTSRVGGIRENATLDFRTEFFNAFNHPEYSSPGTGTASTTYGEITSSAGSPRLIQFALRYIF